MSHDAEDRAERRWEAEQEAERVARHTPALTVSRYGPMRKLVAEPGDEPPCGECGCSEPAEPLHHASDCSHGVSVEERHRRAHDLFGPLATGGEFTADGPVLGE